MKKKWDRQMLPPLIHFALSFLYERWILIFQPVQNIVAAQPMNRLISDRTERVLAYIISKLLAFIIILFLWKLIFFVKKNFLLSRSIRIYVILFAAGLLVNSFLWPTCFIKSNDNFITYSYAIRLLPEYWHNAYSSYVYCGMLMVFPHPVSMSVLQWLFFIFSAGYATYRIEQSPVLRGRGKWLPCLFVLLPRVWVLFTDGYRTEQYAIASMIYITLIAMDIVDHRERTPLEMAEIILFAAFVSVWRTEGIIVGVLSFACLLLWGYRLAWKNTVRYMAGFLAVLLLVFLPNKLGDIKYYGKDYSIVNSFGFLQNALNLMGVPDGDEKYPDQLEDLLAIEKITPLDAIQLYGLDGYRRYNVMCGRRDINQSMADKATANAFLKAYRRLLLHNPKVYLMTQLSMLAGIWEIPGTDFEVPSVIEDTGAYPKWTYDAWAIGSEDYLSTPFTMQWADNYQRQIIYLKIHAVLKYLSDIRSTLKLDLLTYLLLPVSEVLIAFYEFILLLRRKKGLPGLGGLALTLLCLFVAVILAMPAGLRVYFHAYYFMSLLTVGIYISALISSRNLRRKI